MNITKGKIASAKKVVIYGSEGIGKSTFAARFPEPLFIDTEGSTKELDVARTDKPTSWEMLKEQVEYIKKNKPCKTLVIDTIDWAESLCLEALCARFGKKGIEDFGYGNGYTYEKEDMGKFLNLLEEVIEAGINVVLTAHAVLRKFEQPDEMGSYDRWEMKLGKKTTNQISPLIKEWADMVLFANYKTISVAADDKGKKHKGMGGKERVMYTTHHACWDAKNRYGLPDEIPMDYEKIRGIIESFPPTPTASASIPAGETETKPVSVSQEQKLTPPASDNAAKENDFIEAVPDPVIPSDIPKALADLMISNRVSEEEIRRAVSEKGYYPYDMPVGKYDKGFIEGVLIGAWAQVEEMVMSNRYPF